MPPHQTLGHHNPTIAVDAAVVVVVAVDVVFDAAAAAVAAADTFDHTAAVAVAAVGA